MSTPKVTKAKALDTPKKTPERVKPQKVRAIIREGELKVPSVRRTSRAVSSPRCAPTRLTGPQVSQARTRSSSSSTGPKLSAHCTKANPECKKPTCPTKQTTSEAKCSQQGAHDQIQKHQLNASHSHRAFTVIPPDPKKRLEIQKKAEAELAALEELRLSKAKTYVSISPKAVGGCLSLEEVRLKQQQEMMRTKRKP